MVLNNTHIIIESKTKILYSITIEHEKKENWTLYKLKLAQKLEQPIRGNTNEIYEYLKTKIHQAAHEELGEEQNNTRTSIKHL